MLDPLVVEALLARRGSDGPLLGLTEREREVLQEMATGRNNATIAKTLFMSDRAVEKHIGSVFQKLGLVDEHEVNRRVMAVLAYLEASGPEPADPRPAGYGQPHPGGSVDALPGGATAGAHCGHGDSPRAPDVACARWAGWSVLARPRRLRGRRLRRRRRARRWSAHRSHRLTQRCRCRCWPPTVVALLFAPVQAFLERQAARARTRVATPYDVLSRFSETRSPARTQPTSCRPGWRCCSPQGTGAAWAQVWLNVVRPADPGRDLAGDADADRHAAEPWHRRRGTAPARDVEPCWCATASGSSGCSGSRSGRGWRSRRWRSGCSPAWPPRPVWCCGWSRLRAELESRHEELLVRSEELTASRQRLIETQDAERRRLERDIHDGAQQHLVALAVNLRLAQTVAARSPDRAALVLAEQALRSA